MYFICKRGKINIELAKNAIIIYRWYRLAVKEYILHTTYYIIHTSIGHKIFQSKNCSCHTDILRWYLLSRWQMYVLDKSNCDYLISLSPFVILYAYCCKQRNMSTGA